MRKLLFILLVLTGISNVGYGQIINDDKTSNDSIYEYEDDSDYENNMLELDSLCKDYEPHDFIFIPADYLYKHNWDNNIIHNRIENLTQKPDTTIIPLQDIVGRGFVFPKQGFVTSEFGPRRYHFHYGMDTKLNIGDSVVAAFDGVVRIAAYSAGYGYVVVIRHNNGLETIYGHLSQIIANVNQVVRAGDLIGLGGSTGRSTGPHLHFEV
ncbi:MAG: M23 family metallopeptidase, partial [Bacteroidota bacterium]|nr:M23 family metallopeptidase [Bacteroidota bacterium]